MLADEVRELVDKRDMEYATSWKHTGKLMQLVLGYTHKLLYHNPEMYFPWVMILNKLLRILGSPTNRDHWLDIAGYAQLVLDSLPKGEQNGKVQQS